MKDSASALNGARILDASAMRKLKGGLMPEDDGGGGGGGCGVIYEHGGTRYVVYIHDDNGDGATRDDAKREAAARGWNWCCTRCVNFEAWP